MDSPGHPIGDDLLKCVALRLSAGVRDAECVARLGGAEIGIVQVGQQLPAGLASFARGSSPRKCARRNPRPANHLERAWGSPLRLDGTDPVVLLHHAELALYRTKDEGRGTLPDFVTGMDTRAKPRRLELDMRGRADPQLNRNLLSADLQHRDAPYRVLRGSRPLEPSTARDDSAGRVRSSCRGNRPNRFAG